MTGQSKGQAPVKLLLGLVWIVTIVVAFYAGHLRSAQKELPSRPVTTTVRPEGDRPAPLPEPSEFQSNADLQVQKAKTWDLVRLLSGRGLEDLYLKTRNQKPSAQRKRLLLAIFRHWGAIDPQGAIKALSSANPFEKGGLETELFSGWIEKDREAPWRWIEETRKQEGRTGIIDDQLKYTALLDTLEEVGDLRSATGHLGALPAGPEKNMLVQRLALQWGAYEPAGASEWAKTLEPSDLRNMALTGVINSVAIEAPDIAIGLVGDLTTEKSRARLMDSIMIKWAVGPDRQQGAQWISQQPVSPALEPSIGKFAQAAVQYDPALAGTVIQKIQTPETRAKVLETCAGLLQLKSERAAAEWLVANDQYDGSVQRLKKVVTNWAASNPSEASQFISSLNKSPDVKAELTSKN